MIASGTEPWTATAGRLLGVGSLMQGSGQKNAEVRQKAVAFLTASLTDGDDRIKLAACGAVAQMLTMATVVVVADEEKRKAEIRACGQQAVHAFAKPLAKAAGDMSSSSEVRRAAIFAIKQV
jgi:hypothetical protein